VTLPPLWKYPITFPTLGWQVGQWIEAFLPHGPGDVQGQPIVLDLEELAWLCWAYRVEPQLLASGERNPKAGRRLVHRAVYCRSKGMRKSEFGGMVCCAEALGPVRCDGFDASGEPVGRPVVAPFVRVMATEEEQSSNIFENVAYMLANGRVASEHNIDVGRSVKTSTRVYLPDVGGEIVPSTSGDASKDGGKETHCAADETHLMYTKALRSMYSTVARNTGKRSDSEPWMADYTTAWQPGEDSIAEQASDKYAGVDYDEAVRHRGVLFDHKMGDPVKVFGSDNSLRKALRSAYEPFKVDWTDLDRIVRVIRDAEDPWMTANRYFLNRPVEGASQWLAPEEIDRVLGDVTPERREPVTLGFDGSETDDHTVLFGCRENGDLFTIGCWTPSHDQIGWREEVDAAVAWAFGEFRVVRFYADPPFWQSELAQWARRYKSPPVIEFWTNVDSKMAVACGALRSAIRREDDDERVTIDPVPIKTDEQKRGSKTLVAWHFQNARTRKVKIKFEDGAEEAFVVRKERPGSPNKIDSVPSAVLARRARDDAVKANEFEVKEYARAVW